MTDQILLTEAEAADRLRVCPRTLRKARQAGTLHYVLMGRKILYTPTDLESFIERLRKVEPSCPRPVPTRKAGAPRPAGGGVIVPFRERNKRP